MATTTRQAPAASAVGPPGARGPGKPEPTALPVAVPEPLKRSAAE